MWKKERYEICKELEYTKLQNTNKLLLLITNEFKKQCIFFQENDWVITYVSFEVSK